MSHPWGRGEHLRALGLSLAWGIQEGFLEEAELRGAESSWCHTLSAQVSTQKQSHQVSVTLRGGEVGTLVAWVWGL